MSFISTDIVVLMLSTCHPIIGTGKSFMLDSLFCVAK